MAITVTQLTAFLAVVRSGSVTSAADQLVVTQPSVSAAVAALGRELDCDLFERSGRNIRPTEAGAAFAPYAAEVIGLLDRGRRTAREAADVTARRLQVAAVTTAAESFVPPLLRAFAQAHPEIQFTLDVGNRQAVLERVLAHSVDVAITGRPPADERLIADPLMDNEIVCITAADDPGANGTVEVASLARRTWLLREPGSGTRALNERFLVEHQLAPPTLTLGSNGAIRQAARAGLGISLLSRATADVEIEAGLLSVLHLDHAPPPWPWFILHSAVGPVRPPVGVFVDFVRANAGDLVV